MSKPFWIVTRSAGYPELWECVKLPDGTVKPINGPFRVRTP